MRSRCRLTYGENIVMRLLSAKAQHNLPISVFGIDFKKVQRAIKKPYGMVLVTGPTGSGKRQPSTRFKVLNRRDVHYQH